MCNVKMTNIKAVNGSKIMFQEPKVERRQFAYTSDLYIYLKQIGSEWSVKLHRFKVNFVAGMRAGNKLHQSHPCIQYVLYFR